MTVPLRAKTTWLEVRCTTMAVHLNGIGVLRLDERTAHLSWRYSRRYHV